jgi:hypothetical protein
MKVVGNIYMIVVKSFPYLQRYYFHESYELVVPPNSKDEKPKYVHIQHKQVSIFKVLSFYAYSSANTSHCFNDPFVFPYLRKKNGNYIYWFQ